MKGLDTNVLVRYLTQDDARQAAAAVRAIEQAVAESQRLLVQPVVLCELVWVLESAYDLPKLEVIRVLDEVLRTAQFEVVGKDLVFKALSDYRGGKGDFADYWIGSANQAGGAATTLTFDGKLKGHSAFAVLDIAPP